MTHEELKAARVYLAKLNKLESVPAGTAQSLLSYVDELRTAIRGLLSGPSPLHQEARDRLLVVPQHCLDAVRRLLDEVERRNES